MGQFDKLTHHRKRICRYSLQSQAAIKKATHEFENPWARLAKRLGLLFQRFDFSGGAFEDFADLRDLGRIVRAARRSLECGFHDR